MSALKNIIVICLVLSCGHRAVGQQLSPYSQYLNNYYLVNSAAADVRNSVSSIFSYRLGTGNFSGTPKTLYFSAYAPLNKPKASQFMRSAMRVTESLDTTALIRRFSVGGGNHIAGLNVTTDELGLFRKTTVHASYTYHLTLNRQFTLAASPKVGWVNLNLSDDLQVFEQNDQPFQEFLSRYEQLNMMDIGFGLWLYSDKYFFGYSLEQLVKTKDIASEQISGYEFNPHHYILVGTKIRMNQKWSLTPNALLRMVANAPISYDLSIKAEYGAKLWGALSYRKETAIIMMVGGAINDNLSFSYSFDQTINASNANQISAHEIGIQYEFLHNLHK